MSDTAAPQPRGLFYRIPIIGWMARDLVRDFKGNIGYFLLIVLTVLIVAVKTWGLVALGLAALAMVPVMFVVLIMITLGN